MTRTLQDIEQGFTKQRASVLQLLEFDNLVLDHLVGGITAIADRVENQGQRIAANDLRHRLSALKNIRSASSLRGSYRSRASEDCSIQKTPVHPIGHLETPHCDTGPHEQLF